jgi:hypothetical protein
MKGGRNRGCCLLGDRFIRSIAVLTIHMPRRSCSGDAIGVMPAAVIE